MLPRLLCQPKILPMYPGSLAVELRVGDLGDRSGSKRGVLSMGKHQFLGQRNQVWCLIYIRNTSAHKNI